MDHTHINLGFGNCSYSKDKNKNAADVMARPEMINMGSDCDFYRHAVGDLNDRLHEYLMLHNPGEYFDSQREKEFAKLFRESCLGTVSRFEACTLACTFVADLADLLSGDDVNIFKKNIVLRHKDGSNDWRTGYDHTVVFSCLVIVEVDGVKKAYHFVNIGQLGMSSERKQIHQCCQGSHESLQDGRLEGQHGQRFQHLQHTR